MKTLILVVIFFGCIVNNVFADKVNVVATFSILGDIVHHVGGDHVDVQVLVKANGDVHAYEPTPQDVILLSKADLVVENGLHLESWMDRVYRASGQKATRIVATEGIKIRTMVDNSLEVDPHGWQSVQNVKTYALNIKNALVTVDPDNKNAYDLNAQRFIEQLVALDAWIIAQTKDIKNRTIVTNHDALGYYARDYNFDIVGTVIPSGTTEAADPSAQQTVQLIQTIRKYGVKVIFAAQMDNVQLAHVLSEDVGVQISDALFVDALGAPQSEGADYLSMMRHNTMIFKKYLSTTDQQ